MPDSIDLDLQPDSGPPEPPERQRSAGLWIAAGLLILAAAVAAYFAFGVDRGEPVEQVAEAPAPAPAPPAPEPLGGDPAEVEVPPLGESDQVVRDLVGALSSHPQVAAWLTTDGLIRNFTVVVTNIAYGTSPAPRLKPLQPPSKLSVVERDGGMYLDPRSYGRYSAVADAVDALDAEGAARLYATLKPRIEEAHRELGTPDPSFDQTLERAIIRLLSTPIPAEPVAVEPRGIGYGFADERLEGLSAAQKQLLRMGGQNAAKVQRSLRAIALELGIPSERLPQPGR